MLFYLRITQLTIEARENQSLLRPFASFLRAEGASREYNVIAFGVSVSPVLISVNCFSVEFESQCLCNCLGIRAICVVFCVYEE